MELVLNDINYEKLLWMFADPGGDIDTRDDIKQPFEQDGFYVSTDTHSLIEIKKEGLVLPFQQQKTPNYKPVLNSVVSHDPISVNINELEQKLIAPKVSEFEYEYSKCHECSGEGRVRVTYTDKSNGVHKLIADCPKCDGDGDIEKEKYTGKEIDDVNSNFKVWGIGFRYKQLRRLIDACKIIGIESITKVAGTQKEGSLFIVSENIKIIVMPCHLESVLEEGKTITEINL